QPVQQREVNLPRVIGEHSGDDGCPRWLSTRRHECYRRKSHRRVVGHAVESALLDDAQSGDQFVVALKADLVGIKSESDHTDAEKVLGPQELALEAGQRLDVGWTVPAGTQKQRRTFVLI